jgi:hypothetical protein
MINIRFYILLIALGLSILIAPVTFESDGESVCFYLDKTKAEGKLIPVLLTNDAVPSIELRDSGLFHGEERLCQWSRNGGSGVREAFSLDGGFAVPILDPKCESPFGHIYTGVGFGDWYLTLCGRCSDDNLIVSFRDSEYSVRTDSLKQWTEYPPGEFPIEGDRGY